MVLEDNPQARNALVQMLYQIDRDIQVYSTDNVETAFSDAMMATMDVFVIDIILNPQIAGDVSGFLFAEKIRLVKKYEFTPVIFITSLQDLNNSAYKLLHAYEYIEKPFDPAAVKKTLLGALNYTTPREGGKVISFRRDGILYTFEASRIIYAEVNHHAMTIHGCDKKLDVPYMTCDRFLKQVDSGDFLKCSRGTIVNRKYIENVDRRNRMIRLRGISEPVYVGMTYLKKVVECIHSDLETVLDI